MINNRICLHQNLSLCIFEQHQPSPNIHYRWKRLESKTYDKRKKEKRLLYKIKRRHRYIICWVGKHRSYTELRLLVCVCKRDMISIQQLLCTILSHECNLPKRCAMAFKALKMRVTSYPSKHTKMKFIFTSQPRVSPTYMLCGCEGGILIGCEIMVFLGANFSQMI